MEDIKVFTKGLNNDLSPVFQQDSTYLDGLNIELINDENQGSIAVSNSKGNKFQLRLDDTTPIIKITYQTSGDTNIDINNQMGTGVNINNIKDLYDYIKSDPAYTFLNTLYRIYYSDVNLYIYPLNSTIITVNIIGSSGLLLDTNYIPAQSNIKVIGYGVIRDNIYLFATANNSLDPKSSNDGYGFIYKIFYNNITFNELDATKEIIYAGNLNFSTYWHIPQTAVVGMYENALIQRLYWSDNYNKLRSINVADPQIGALDLTLIDVQSSIGMDIPTLKNITSAPGTAEIKIGCYQLAYRLSNVGGGTTNYSVPSNPVFVVNAAEESQTTKLAWKDYHGDIAGTKTTKRITWKINAVDTNFSRIEAIVLYKDNKNAVATVTSFYDNVVTGNSMEITLDGDILYSTSSFDVPIDDYTIIASTFTHCKTIGTKDNRLVVANVRNEVSEINNIEYDARAYRFNPSSSIKLINVKGQAANSYTSSDYNNIDEFSDAINPYNLLTNDPAYDSTVKYKANGTTIGGEGPNISYEFVSVAVGADDTPQVSNPQSLPLFSTTPNGVPVPTASEMNLNVFSRNENNVDVLQIYPNTFPSKINDGTKYPQMNSLLWGYQNNEIYRFGIQFYDKQKVPYFTKWIADIKFPDYFDPCLESNVLNEDGTPVGALQDHRIIYTPSNSSTTYTMQLGIKFNVNIPVELTNKISGYSIVRVKREEFDKTVVAEGIISNKMQNVATSSYKLPSGAMAYSQPGSDVNRVNFITPNMLDSSLLQPSSGMKLRISSHLLNINSTFVTAIAGGTGDINNYIFKLYDHASINSQYEANIDYANLMGLNAYTNFGLDNYNNYYDESGTLGIGVNNGNPAYLLVINGPGIPEGLTSGYNRFLAYIYNPIINQYGGNTYANRGNNSYILCSHFRSVQTSTSAYLDNPTVFGGDVINGLMDEERVSKDFTTRDPAREFSTTFIYPSKSPVNRELRHGRHPNISLTDVVTNNNERTDYFYNVVYSSQNDILTFNAKPSTFISVASYDNRFYISEIKISGELIDSWSMFKPNNYWDVEGDKGPINSMLVLGSKMYFWQDRAFGIIEINPRILLNDESSTANSQVSGGTGLPLQRHDYISTVVGCKHQSSTISSSNKLYWVDINTKKIYSFDGRSETPLSDIEGLYSYLNKNIDGYILNVDKPVFDSLFPVGIGNNGIVATYDHKRHKAIFTFHSGSITNGLISQKSFTVVFNELLNCFTTRHSFTPKIYINDYKVLISTNNNDLSGVGLSDLYIHDLGEYGNYYGVVYPSYLKFIVNKEPKTTKVFDNITYDSQVRIFEPLTNSYINFNDETWSSIRITNDYQNTDTQILVLNDNIKRQERTWQLAIPRNRVLYTLNNSPNIYTDLSVGNKPFGERLRDKYIQVELIYDNQANHELLMNNLTTQFRVSQG